MNHASSCATGSRVAALGSGPPGRPIAGLRPAKRIAAAGVCRARLNAAGGGSVRMVGVVGSVQGPDGPPGGLLSVFRREVKKNRRSETRENFMVMGT